MQLYSFTFGDTSFDGHEKTDTYYFKCNRDRKQISALFRKFEQLVGLSFSNNSGLPTIFADYEEDYITKRNLDKILVHAHNKREIIELFECDTSGFLNKADIPESITRFNGNLTEDEVVPAYDALPTTYKGRYWSKQEFDFNLGVVVTMRGDDHDIKLKLADWICVFPYFVFECLRIVDSDLQYEESANDVPELIEDRIGYGLFL